MSKIKITKPTLLLHNFVRSEDNKNIWIKKTASNCSYTYYTYKYYWKERVLEIVARDCVGFIIYIVKITNELDIYKEIMIN